MWKLEFIEGGIIYVKIELEKLSIAKFIIKEESKFIYLKDDVVLTFDRLKNLKTITKVYSILTNSAFNPKYIAKNKSILGEIISPIINQDSFNSFKVQCAGTNTPEINSIIKYINQEFKLEYDLDNPDLKIHIIKAKDSWELGAQITPKPLSWRDYKVSHMSGALNPTVAYGMNLLAKTEEATSYLNPFSGSGTLLIEACIQNPHLQEIVGFDIDKSALTSSIHNIKEAGLIRKIKVKSLDIFEEISLGKFDIIASDLPFGMAISKHTDIGYLYKKFINFSENHLTKNGRLVVVTSETDLFKKIIKNSNFKIISEINLKSVTSINSYLKTTIFLCK